MTGVGCIFRRGVGSAGSEVTGWYNYIYVTKLSPGSNVNSVGEERAREALSQYHRLPCPPMHTPTPPTSG